MQLSKFFFVLFLSSLWATLFFSADYYEKPHITHVCQAAANGDLHMLTCLIKNGLDYNLFRGDQQQPLCIITKNFYKMFSSSCMHCKILQQTCSNHACQKKYAECLELLCRHKWPVNAQDEQHNTALHHLIYTLIYSFDKKNDYTKLFFSIKLLLMQNARVDIKNNNKKTVLELVNEIPQECIYKKYIVALVRTKNSILLSTPVIFD